MNEFISIIDMDGFQQFVPKEDMVRHIYELESPSDTRSELVTKIYYKLKTKMEENELLLYTLEIREMLESEMD